ncbi:MAG: enoyl-CoA hydratase-related protein, partial [Bradyrhizobium sp.]
MAYETIKYEVAEQILTITLNRPDKLNAFNATMQQELIDAFDKADKDDDVRAIIVTGEGRGFCAGMDMQALSALGAAGGTGNRVDEDYGLDAQP